MYEIGGNPRYIYGQTSVGATATELVAPNERNRIIRVVNMDTVTTIFVGDSVVTSDTGFPVAPGATLAIASGRAQGLYATIAGGSSSLSSASSDSSGSSSSVVSGPTVNVAWFVETA